MVHKNEKTVTIPFPRATANVNRGYNNETPKMHVRCIRITAEDRHFIEKTANKLNMSFSEFVRWASYYTALEVSNEVTLQGFQDRNSVKITSLADEGFK